MPQDIRVSPDGKTFFVADMRAGGVFLVDSQIVATWPIPGGGSPDMGDVSADGKTLWFSGRYGNVVYAIDTTMGEVRAIPVGKEPHGLTVWPQPGRGRWARPHSVILDVDVLLML